MVFITDVARLITGLMRLALSASGASDSFASVRGELAEFSKTKK
jgi:hypothetical protein